MYKKRRIDILIQIIANLSFVVLLIGFALGIIDILYPPTTNALTQQENVPSATQDERQKNIVSLGDSLTRGIGDEKGLGYIGIIRHRLQQKHPNRSIQLTNLAISGQTSSQLVEQLKQKQVSQLIKQADWIPLTIGGNDLKESVEDFQLLDTTKAEQNRKQFATNLKQILTTIRSHNRQAPILIFALYHPYGDLADHERTAQTVLKWNETFQQIGNQYPNVVIIPTFDLFQLQPKKYLSSDHFHPNHFGYQQMADRMWQIMVDPTQKGDE